MVVHSNPPGAAFNEQIANAFPLSYAEVSRVLMGMGREGQPDRTELHPGGSRQHPDRRPAAITAH